MRDHYSFNAAQSNCETLGGELFDAVNGTASQLQFLPDKMGHTNFYLGMSVSVTNTSNTSVWNNMKGVPIADDDLLWLPHEPTLHGKNVVVVDSLGLNDVESTRLETSVCNLNI